MILRSSDLWVSKFSREPGFKLVQTLLAWSFLKGGVSKYTYSISPDWTFPPFLRSFFSFQRNRSSSEFFHLLLDFWSITLTYPAYSTLSRGSQAVLTIYTTFFYPILVSFPPRQYWKKPPLIQGSSVVPCANEKATAQVMRIFYWPLLAEQRIRVWIDFLMC